MNMAKYMNAWFERDPGVDCRRVNWRAVRHVALEILATLACFTLAFVLMALLILGTDASWR